MFLINWFRSIFRSLRSFARNESGMTLPMLGITMIGLTAMTGLAIDIARLQMVQAKLQFSLDAAGLAAGSTVNTANVNTEVSKYLTANFNGYIGSTLTGTSVTVSADNSVITLAASASLPTTFLQVLGIATMNTNAHTQITRSASGLELVLVLDNTGSMSQSAGGGVSKISALKTAASTLINTLFGSGTASNLWVGIVPFSQAVNIGTGNNAWVDTVSYSPDWGPTSWGGCVDARVIKSPPIQMVIGNSSTIDMDITDDPPSVQKFTEYYYDSASENFWRYYLQCVTTWNRCKSGRCTHVSPTCSTSGGYTCTLISPTCQDVTQCTADATTTCGPVTYASPLNTTSLGPNVYCPQALVPMTSDKNTLLNTINSLTAQGDTHIDLGMAWGWRMLSPRWRGTWGGAMATNSLPLDYNTPHMAKAIVLLTDGDNTIDNNDRTAYEYLGSGKLGTTDSATALSQLNNRTTQVCATLKANNVYVYTIALGSQISSTGLSLLSNCATSSTYAFVSPTTTTLSSIFSTIGDSLSNLRVSQ